jgi:peptidylprolyl isomerase
MTIRTTIAILSLPLLFVAGCQKKEAAKPQAATISPAPTPRPPVSLPGLATTGDATEMAPGVWTWDVQVGEGEAVGPNARTVTVSIEGWTQDGTQYFGSATGPDELVLPATSAAAFPGWAAAIDGLNVGGTRKVWAAKPTGETTWPVDYNSPIVLDITLRSVNANATIGDPLPGADVASAAAQGGADGLRFYDLVTGTGTAAQVGDTITVRYEAWLADGTPMAQSTGDAITITLNDSIAPGIANGLVGTTAGSTRKLIVPAAIGIGFDPLGTLPAGSTVVMDVEVVEVISTKPAATPITAEAG